MKTRFLIIIGVITTLAMTFFVVGFDQGHILSIIYGDQAFTDLYIHELTHDMRHAAGFDCHDKNHNGTLWNEAYGLVMPQNYTEPTILWKEAMFGIRNGTGYAELSITDHNSNQNPTYREKIKAHVHSDFDPIGNTIELYETEKNSGIFERKFAISTIRTAPEVLMTAEGDTITASYGDLSYQNKSKDSKSRFTALVGSLGYPMERVHVFGDGIKDLDGNRINFPIVGQQILLESVLTSSDREEQFVLI